MAGTARPSDDILIGSKVEMTDYVILGDKSGNGSNRAKNLFNESIGGYYGDAFDWNYSGDYIDIQIDKPCNLYVYLATNAYTQNSQLNITPETYEEQHTLAKGAGWQLYVTGLQPGTYTFASIGENRNDTEWFFEEITTSSDNNTNEGNGTGGNTGSDTEEGDNTNGETGSGGSNSGEDNEATEEVIKISKIIKDSVKNTIINNKLIQEHLITEEDN